MITLGTSFFKDVIKCHETYLYIGFREKASFPSGVSTLPPAFSYIRSGNREDIPGNNAHLSSIGLSLEIIQGQNLIDKIVESHVKLDKGLDGFFYDAGIS